MVKRNWSRFLSAVLALCLCVALVPAAAAVDELPTVRHISLSTAAQERSDRQSYTATYTASLIMGEQFAKIVAVNKDDTETLKSLRFTCTLEDALVKQLTSVSQSDFTFSGPGAANFEFVSAGPASTGIEIVYQLKDSVVEGWHTATTESVMNQMNQLMQMTATKTVSASQLTDAKDSSGRILTDAKVVVSMAGGGAVPFYSKNEVLAAQVQDVIMDIRGYVSGGSGGGGGSTNKPLYPVNPSETESGKISTSVDKAAEDQKVTITVTPDPGYIINRVIVTDENGRQIVIRAIGDNNTYTFEGPGTAVDVQATFIREPVSPAVTGVGQLLNTDSGLAYLQGKADNNFYPNESITRGQVATIFYRLLADTNVDVSKTFKDVPEGFWCEDAVNTLAALGIVNGMTDEEFAPNKPITRAQFVAICARFAQASAAGEQFHDVPESYWAYDHITTASGYGWINGVGNGLFAPDQPITRAQAATIVNRMLARIADRARIDAGGRQYDDVPGTYWAWYDISEASTGIIPR